MWNQDRSSIPRFLVNRSFLNLFHSIPFHSTLPHCPIPNPLLPFCALQTGEHWKRRESKERERESDNERMIDESMHHVSLWKTAKWHNEQQPSASIIATAPMTGILLLVPRVRSGPGQRKACMCRVVCGTNRPLSYPFLFTHFLLLLPNNPSFFAFLLFLHSSTLLSLTFFLSLSPPFF